jgi:hypothetical protein
VFTLLGASICALAHPNQAPLQAEVGRDEARMLRFSLDGYDHPEELVNLALVSFFSKSCLAYLSFALKILSDRLFGCFISSFFHSTWSHDHLVQYIDRHPQRDNLDIWQSTPSTLDIYFPSSSSPIPRYLTPFPCQSSVIPPHSYTPPHRVGDDSTSRWNLSTLENNTFHQSYHPLYEIEAFMLELEETFPSHARVVQIGETSEGRVMHALEIFETLPQAQEETNHDSWLSVSSQWTNIWKPKKKEKPAFVIMGAQHAREVRPISNIRILQPINGHS